MIARSSASASASASSSASAWHKVKVFVGVHNLKTIEGIHLKLGTLTQYQKGKPFQQGL